MSETCVDHVRRLTGLPHTSEWRQGVKVRGADLAPGVAIATFNDAGLYENDTTGKSHAAILIEETSDGLVVRDAWIGHPAARRVIQFRGGHGKPVDDGDQYFQIET